MSVILDNSDPRNGGASEAGVVEKSYYVVEQETSERATPLSTMAGRAKRREKKLRHEPLNLTAESDADKIQVMNFLEARSSELNSMLKALREKGGSKRTFQKLPRHIRRRAMSHNPKRLPRKFRDKAEKEVSKFIRRLVCASVIGCNICQRCQPRFMRISEIHF